MPNIETTAGATPTTGGGKADWSAVQEDFSDVIIKQEEKPVEPTTEPKQEEIKIEEKLVEKPTEEKPVVELTAEEIKLAAETLVKEAKELGLPENATKEDVAAAKAKAEPTPLEFKLDDITGVPEEYQDGTYKAFAKTVFNVDLPEESQEAFQKAFVTRDEFEKVQTTTLDTLLSTFKPEVATAIKLMQMGIPEDQVLAPTKQIEEYLALDDAALLRADFELQGDMGADVIDSEMEKLSAEPQKLKLEAEKLRIYLNREKNQIVEQRKQYLQKYEQDKQSAALELKKQEQSKITDALNNVSTFMDIPVNKDVKEAIIRKYNNGLYDNVLNDPAKKAEFLFHTELGAKLAKHIQNKASETAKADVRKQLLNTPPVISGGGNAINNNKQPEKDNPWGALNDFKS